MSYTIIPNAVNAPVVVDQPVAVLPQTRRAREYVISTPVQNPAFVQSPTSQFVVPQQVVQSPTVFASPTGQILSTPTVQVSQPIVAAPQVVASQPQGQFFTQVPQVMASPTQVIAPPTQVIASPTQVFASPTALQSYNIVSPAFTSAQYQVLRSGDYWFTYTDSKGERSWMLHLGALSPNELVFAQNFPQMVRDRLQSLFSGTAESSAYANPNFAPIYGAITGNVSLVNVSGQVTGAIWSRRTLEGYILAPFDASSTESLAFSRVPEELKPFIYPSYYQRV